MKAWLVNRNDEWCSIVVFAETRGKAKSYALRTESFEDVDYCELDVRRVKQMDKYYAEEKKGNGLVQFQRPNCTCKGLQFYV